MSAKRRVRNDFGTRRAGASPNPNRHHEAQSEDGDFENARRGDHTIYHCEGAGVGVALGTAPTK
jgi:hypothetical protein